MSPDPANATNAPASNQLPVRVAGRAAAAVPSWSWPIALVSVVFAVAFGYHEYPSATFFQTDDYVWRLWSELETNPWRAFCDDLAAGQAFRPLRYLSWYGLELLIPHVPAIVPIAVMAGFICYGCSAGFLAWLLSRDRWIGLTTAVLLLLGPLLGPSTLSWYSVLEDMMPVALMLLACTALIQCVRTGRISWLVAALVPATLAGLWKEISLAMPALAIVVLAATANGTPAPAESARGRHLPLLLRLRWCLPFVCLAAVLCIWRYRVIGSSGLIGHHALPFADSATRLEQLITLAGLTGSLPVGLFYAPAVARSFPISMKLTSDAWSMTQQFVCLLTLTIIWLAWIWISPNRKTLLIAGCWYLVGWVPAMALTVVQPSYLYLPAFAVCLLIATALRDLVRRTSIFALVTVAISWVLAIGVARHWHDAVPIAGAVRTETQSLLQMIRQEGPRWPAGTRVIVVGSHVLRPDIVAELDAAYHHERCNFDLYNFDAAPVDLIAPAVPLDVGSMGPLVISTEGLREGHINMAGRQLYFVDLRGSKQQLADPRWNNRFWTPTRVGWQDITDLIRGGESEKL